MPSMWPVQLLDLSLGGVSFVSPYALDVGRTASVRATFGRDAFSGQIRVCWTRSRGGGASPRQDFEVGAVFLPLADESRRALQGFLKVPRSE